LAISPFGTFSLGGLAMQCYDVRPGPSRACFMLLPLLVVRIGTKAACLDSCVGGGPEAGGGRLEAGGGRLEAGGGRLEAGGGRLEAGDGRLEAGGGRLEAGRSRAEFAADRGATRRIRFAHAKPKRSLPAKPRGPKYRLVRIPRFRAPPPTKAAFLVA
jgi:hypothetical protein